MALAPGPPPGLHRVVVRVEVLVRPAAGRGERVDQRAAVLHPVILIKRMDHGAGVTAGRRRIGAGRIGLPGDRVDRSRRRAVLPPLPRRLAYLSQPERVVASLGPCRPIPRHSYCLQEPEPAEELVGIGTYRRRRAVARCEITQELRHRRHLGAGPVHQPVGHWSLRDLLDPAGPWHYQLGDVPFLLARHICSQLVTNLTTEITAQAGSAWDGP
jgi:hypothetical protein